MNLLPRLALPRRFRRVFAHPRCRGVGGLGLNKYDVPAAAWLRSRLSHVNVLASAIGDGRANILETQSRRVRDVSQLVQCLCVLATLMIVIKRSRIKILFRGLLHQFFQHFRLLGIGRELSTIQSFVQSGVDLIQIACARVNQITPGIDRLVAFARLRQMRASQRIREREQCASRPKTI